MHPIELLASAIATQEGFFNPSPDLANINNNPGNQRASVLNRLKDSHGFVKFQSKEEGIACLITQLSIFVARNYTLRQLITQWAPPTGADGGNNTNAYIAFVAKTTGLDPDTPLIKMWTISKVS